MQHLSIGKEFGLKVFMSEKLTKMADSGTKYYGIAVVKKSSNLTFSKLKVRIFDTFV